MQLVTRLIALSRAVQLRRQFRGIEKALVDLQPNARRQLAAIAMREFQNASKSEFPHLYATPPDVKYHAWGSGAKSASSACARTACRCACAALRCG